MRSFFVFGKFPFNMLSIEEKLFKKSLDQMSTIKEGRLNILDKIAVIVGKDLTNSLPVNFVFVCTHNSRRSQMAEFALKSFLNVLHFSEIGVYSCGIEKTAVAQPVIELFKNLGLDVTEQEHGVMVGKHIVLTSKNHKDPSLPQNLLAIMVCDHAAESCPFVPSFTQRFSLEFHDPKSSDGSPEEVAAYHKAWTKISREMAYLALKIEENVRG